MKLLLLALVCSLTISSAQAYNCYACNSITDPGCVDPFNKDSAPAGWKVPATASQRCQKVKAPGGIITRGPIEAAGCINGDNKCFEVSVPIIGKTSTCCCNSDLCNGVTSVRQQPIVIFGIISTLIIFIYSRF